MFTTRLKESNFGFKKYLRYVTLQLVSYKDVTTITYRAAGKRNGTTGEYEV